MAEAREDILPDPERFDGAFRCRLCPDQLPSVENDWCPVAAGVVCEDCCRALMMGDARLLDAVAKRLGRGVDQQDVIERCMQCERLVRLVSETAILGESEGVRLPLH